MTSKANMHMEYSVSGAIPVMGADFEHYDNTFEVYYIKGFFSQVLLPHTLTSNVKRSF